VITDLRFADDSLQDARVALPRPAEASSRVSSGRSRRRSIRRRSSTWSRSSASSASRCATCSNPRSSSPATRVDPERAG
jgi:hypothetical protein